MRWGCVVWAVCTESFHMIYPRVHRSSGWVNEWVVGWVQCSACVTGKSSDPKINWLENNVSCIYWFMFILTCDQDIATAFGLSCSWFSRFSWFSLTILLTPNTHCFPTRVCNCAEVNGSGLVWFRWLLLSIWFPVSPL